jgi:hypothetical protein
MGEESSQEDGEVEAPRLLLIEGDLLGIEPQEVELDLKALEAAVSLARRVTSPGRGSSDDAVGGRELIGRLREALGSWMVGLELEKLLAGNQIEPYEAQAKAHDQPEHHAFPTWLVVLQFGRVLPRRRWYIKRRLAVPRRVSSDPASHWLVV